jgi:ABC-type nitrate/sulfonate/bicarbonate transport system substrate-binding protein
MRRKKTRLAAAVGYTLLLLNSLCFAAASPEALTVGYSSFSGAYLPLWIAVEQGLGTKYGPRS